MYSRHQSSRVGSTFQLPAVRSTRSTFPVHPPAMILTLPVYNIPGRCGAKGRVHRAKSNCSCLLPLSSMLSPLCAMPSPRPTRPLDPAVAARVPPNQALTQKWPVLHSGSVPKVDLAAWRFRINGFTDGETVLTWEEFAALPRVRLTADFHCVTGWSRLDNAWQGVPVREVVQLQPPLPAARFVMVHGMNGYSTNLPLNEFLGDDALFATHHDGAPLTAEHGGPLRLVVPR